MDRYQNLRMPELGRYSTQTGLAAGLADILLEALPEDVRVRLPGSTVLAINSLHVDDLAGLLQEVVAYTVASIIDAGSERDAVMENEELAAALRTELRGWAA